MRGIDAVSGDATTRPLSTVRSKLLEQTSQEFAKKDVFPPNPATPAQVASVRADHGAPVQAPVPAVPPAGAQPAPAHHAARRSVDTRA